MLAQVLKTPQHPCVHKFTWSAPTRDSIYPHNK